MAVPEKTLTNYFAWPHFSGTDFFQTDKNIPCSGIRLSANLPTNCGHSKSIYPTFYLWHKRRISTDKR
jgi:hypothetical protein